MGIVEPILRGMVFYIAKAIIRLFVSLIGAIPSEFSPNMDTFYNFFGGSDARTELSILFQPITYMAYLICFGIFIYHIFLIMLGKFAQEKQTVFVLFARFIATIFIIASGTVLPTYMMNMASVVYDFSDNGYGSIAGYGSISDVIKDFMDENDVEKTDRGTFEADEEKGITKAMDDDVNNLDDGGASNSAINEAQQKVKDSKN